MIVGGIGEKVLDRVLAYGDEWMPNRIKTVESLAERIEELRERAGRRVPVTFFNAKPEERAIERLRSAGVDGCVFRLACEEPGEVERRVDELAGFVG